MVDDMPKRPYNSYILQRNTTKGASKMGKKGAKVWQAMNTQFKQAAFDVGLSDSSLGDVPCDEWCSVFASYFE